MGRAESVDFPTFFILSFDVVINANASHLGRLRIGVTTWRVELTKPIVNFLKKKLRSSPHVVSEQRQVFRSYTIVCDGNALE